MAQKRRAATRPHGATSSGQGRSRNQRRKTGRRAAGGQSPGARQEVRGRVSGGYSAMGKTAASGARRLLAEARDMAQSVGETTMGTARGIASGARGAAIGVASGAKGAAIGVASRTQETAKQVAGKVRENPWPAMLIGAGATWMVIDAARGGDRRQTRRSPRSEERGGRSAGRLGNRSKGNMATQAISAVAGAGRSVGGRVGQFVRENPLLAGGAALGIGMAVGLALPSTVTENEMLGGARDAVVTRAKETARNTVRGVAHAANSAFRR